MFMKNKLIPPGCNPSRPDDRMPVAQVVSGDTWEIHTQLFAADGGPASPDNSHVEFVLAENQFSPPIWTGVWYTGVVQYENRAGFVRVVIPRDITKTLRRGSYQFSLRVADRMRQTYNTQLVGHFLVEYAPTSDQHSIPYRDGTSEIFSSGGKESVQPTQQNRSVWVQDEVNGTFHKVVAVRDKETNEVALGVHQEGVTL